jgi:hypothetical protein
MEINNEQELEAAIAAMESQHRHEGRLLIDEFNQAFERIQPKNILKNIFTEATSSPELKDNLINTTVGIATGYATKLLVSSGSAGPIRKLIGSGLMFGVSNLISNNPEKVKLVGNTLISIGKHLFAKRKSKEPDQQD